MSSTDNDKQLFLFASTRLFLRALSVAESMTLPHRVIAVPERLTALCGMCIEVDATIIQTLSEALYAAEISYTITQ